MANTDVGRVLRLALDAWIPRGTDVAIVDVPVNRNAGDLFIYAVTDWLLADMGCRVVYRAGVRDYRTGAARRLVHGETVIVGLGGGNLGDLYPRYQALRERVVADFPHNRIVVFPQTIHFERAQARASAAARLRRHPDLRIAARDHQSLAIARELTPHAQLLPDVVHAAGAAALAELGPAAPGVAGGAAMDAGTLYLLRRDGERAASRTRRGTAGGRRPAAGRARGAQAQHDWPDVFPDLRQRLAVAALLMPAAPSFARAGLHESWRAFASALFTRAVSHVRRFDRVVTDRLHGAILARLADRPVTVLDNSYGKLAAYHEAWWRDDPAIALEREL